MVEPIKFTAETRNDDELVIEKADLSAYALPDGREEALLETEQVMFVEIASVAFPGATSGG